MSWLLVTPARNEVDRLPRLAASLAAQVDCPIGLWVVVDDGSTDGTADCVPADLPFPVHVCRRGNSGGLAGGSAFAAFKHGADVGLRLAPDAEWIMKVDADVSLAPDYFARLRATAGDAALVSGVVIEPGVRTRPGYTRGPLKAYSRAGYAAIAALPVALAWDVMDEVLLRHDGRRVHAEPRATATVSRRTGSSEGDLAGRRRAGVVARWTGYHPLYLLARLARYSTKRPVGIGAVVMAWAWLRAGPGPYAAELKRAHRSEQVARMRAAVSPAPRRTPASPPPRPTSRTD